MSTLLQTFQNAIASATPQPLGVKVSPDLWRELRAANMIQRHPAEGLWPFDEWRYGNVYVVFDPELELEDVAFRLPPNR